MIRRLIILLLIVGCGMFDKTYKCKLNCELLDPPNDYYGGCNTSPIQVDAFDIDEAEEYCYDWYEIESLNSTSEDWLNYSCSCELFN